MQFFAKDNNYKNQYHTKKNILPLSLHKFIGNLFNYLDPRL